MEYHMTGKLLTLTILSTLAFSAQAKLSCKILMDGFDADGKKTIYDLSSREKEKYKKCLDDMRLVPNNYKSFEERTEREASKRKQAYKKKERSKKDAEEQKQIAKTREFYTFSAADLEDIFNKPVYGYRFAKRARFTDGLDHSHHSLQKLTDISELCAAIGKEYEMKGFKAIDAKMKLEDGVRERNNLNEQGVIIPDSFWTSHELFETDQKTRDKMRQAGANKFQILEFSEVTCSNNENKKDDYEDITPEVTLLTKTKEFTDDAESEYITLAEDLEVGEAVSRDRVGSKHDGDYKREPKTSIQSEVDAILGLDVDVREDLSTFR